MIEIRLASTIDLIHIQTIAEETWPITFGNILEASQIRYMLDWMYSLEVLQKQLEQENHVFLLAIAHDTNEVLGFTGIQHDCKPGHTKIHKLYIRPNQQGKGVGKSLIDKIIHLACNQSAKGLFLNVNKYNMQAIKFYKHIGFVEIDEEVIDIGQGYVMDDYIMQMPLVC